MNHNEIVSLLEVYVQGRLEPDQAQSVELHLQQCGSCRGEVEDLQRYGAEIRDYCQSRAEAPRRLWLQRLQRGELPPQAGNSATENGGGPKKGGSGFWLWVWSRAVPQPATAAALAIFFSLGIVVRPFISPSFLGVGRASQLITIQGPTRSIPEGQPGQALNEGTIKEISPETEALSFRLPVDYDRRTSRYRCQIFYREGRGERLVVDRIVPAVGDELGLVVPSAEFPQGRYRIVWSKVPQGAGEEPLEGYFKLIYLGSSPPP